jgi:hypothetical protein
MWREKIPSAAKSRTANEVFTARLKPRPFKTTIFQHTWGDAPG